MAQLNYLTDEQSLFMAPTPENIALLQSEGRGALTSNIPEAAGFFRARAASRRLTSSSTLPRRCSSMRG